MKFIFKLLILILLITHDLFSQWTADSLWPAKVSEAPDLQCCPEIADDGWGGAIIVWQDYRNKSPMVYAQRIDSTGKAKWTENGIIISSAVESRGPKITSDGKGGAFITWLVFKYAQACSVFVQRVNGDGDTLWQANGIPVTAMASGNAATVITGYGAEGAIITWIGTNDGIYSQKIDTSGTIKWKDGGVLVNPAGDKARNPQVVPDDAGGAIISWYGVDSTEYSRADYNIYAQRVDPDGHLVWPGKDTICYDPIYRQRDQRAVRDGTGGAIITWIDSRSYGESYSDYIYAQRVNSSGVNLWDKNGIKISDMAISNHPEIACDTSGGAYITWKGYGKKFYVQHVNKNGALRWSEDLMAAVDLSPTFYNPLIAEDNNGGAYISWAGYGPRVQHFNAEGVLSFPIAGTFAYYSGGGVQNQKHFADSKGRLFITWQVPIYYSNIYANQIIAPAFKNDKKEEPDPEEPDVSPDEYSISQNYPNPFNSVTNIKYSLPDISFINLRIYNSLGEELKTLVNEEKPAGIYDISWNAANLPSGIYFYRMQAGSFVQIRKMILLK